MQRFYLAFILKAMTNKLLETRTRVFFFTETDNNYAHITRNTLL